jgi:hypothetical protein
MDDLQIRSSVLIKTVYEMARVGGEFGAGRNKKALAEG